MFLEFSAPVFAQKLAFPGAQGWAAYTPGGRGGKIIKVTNLNSEGEGSLAAAIAEDVPRIIVFEVAGVIDMQGGGLYINNPFITIAGQTAPSPGITIIDGTIGIKTNDVIIQHLKVRTGVARHTEKWEPDGISTYKASNVIIDHCSVSWAVDENCSASGPRFEGNTPDDWRRNTSHIITMSNNIISEGVSHSLHSKGEHSKGTLIHDNVTKVAIVNNLYASNVNRNPLLKGGTNGVIVNNYIYNPGSSAIRYSLVDSEWGDHAYQKGKISVVNNFLQLGPSSVNMPLFIMRDGPCALFMEGNLAKDMDGKEITKYRGDKNKLVSSKPIWHENLYPIPADDLLGSMERNVGARPWDRDNNDSRIIEETRTLKGKIINSEIEVEGLPSVGKTVYSPFNKSEWNMEYMVRLSPDLIIQKIVDSNVWGSNSKNEISLDTETFNNEIEYAELFCNGKSIERDYEVPYKWDINKESSVTGSFVVFIECRNGMCYTSKNIQIP